MKKTLSLIIFLIGGLIFMTGCTYNANFVEENRAEIEENVKNYFARYHLEPEKVVINEIYEPVDLPTGESQFLIFIEYKGYPYITTSLYADAQTLQVVDYNEKIISIIFNELYIEGRYEDFKTVTEYLEKNNVKDPFRPNDYHIKYFYTNFAHDSKVNEEIKKVYKDCHGDLPCFKQYININLEKLKSLNTTIQIKGYINGMSDEGINDLRKLIIQHLPKARYDVEVGIDNWDTGNHEGLFEVITVK